MKARLAVKDGPGAGQEVELGRLGSFTIGRRSANDLSFVEKGVSRKHCRIDHDGELYWLVDCDSHNGTFVNGRNETKCLLYNGDVIKVGTVTLAFSMPEQEGEEGQAGA
ncbi:MAG: FHA domain-containing protein [Candidatus Brocadiae bacterium]|nr:FHA domain-containing protein [Candidatus Brocadiia bacterium]